MDRKLAYIIATCDRPELIQEFCDTVASYYSDFFDIYIYDSSKSDETELACKKFEYVRYIQCSKGISLPEKVYDILVDFSKRSEYSYIWLASDSLRYKKKGIDRIVNAVNSEAYDMVVLDHFNYNGDNEIYDDVDSFFQNCIWMTTLLGSVILKRGSMLQQFDKVLYHRIFCDSEIIDWSINYFYFHKASTVENFKALQLNTNGQINFSFRKKNNYWRKNAFKLYCEEWGRLFDLLPVCYTNKEKVLRQSAYDAIIGDESAFIKLRIDGIFSLREYVKYKKIWEKISYVKKGVLFSIALTPKIIYKIPFFFKSKLLLHKIRKLKKRYETVIVYGIGAQGYRFSEYAKLHGIDIDLYCTSRKKGQESFCGYPVVEFDDLKKLGNIGVILAMTPYNCKEVLRKLRIQIDEDQILFDKNMSTCVDFELGYKFIAGNAWM